MFGLGRKTEAARGAAWRLKVVRESETGLVRRENQDSLLVDGAAKVFCVADGMGGDSEGALASEKVCARMRQAIAGAGSGFVERMEAIAGALNDANSEIHVYAKGRGYRQMGSTAAVLMFALEGPSRAAVCHVGDSRVYRIRRGLASALTRDHSVGFELGSMAGANRAESFMSRSNPLAHILTRAIGAEPEVVPDWRRIDVMEGDRFVICSDGVHDVITDSRLGFLVGYDPLEKARVRLAEEIVKRGAPDNYSFILLEVCGAS